MLITRGSHGHGQSRFQGKRGALDGISTHPDPRHPAFPRFCYMLSNVNVPNLLCMQAPKRCAQHGKVKLHSARTLRV
jgi:hypothetical protein